MESESNKSESMLAKRVLLAFGVVIASSVLLFVVAHHAGVDDAPAFGARIGVAIVGVAAVLADRVYVRVYGRK